MSMAFPDELQSLVDTALAEVNDDPAHRLSPPRRRRIYDAFKAFADPLGQRARAWLAVITARRVLPLFRQEFPKDTLPQELLDAAIGVLQGTLDDAAVDEIQEHGYNASGNAWGHDESEMPWNADMAGCAAYHALKEARGQEPLGQLDKYFNLGVVSWPTGKSLVDHPRPIRADTFSDEDLCQIENCDAASAAVVAYSCDPGGPLCDPSKVHEFWVWWLTVAIPESWQTAQL